jgi:hypothetical protein
MKIIACSLLVFGAAENRHIAAAIVIEIINNPVPLPLAVLVNDDLPLGGADAWASYLSPSFKGDPGRMLHRDRFLKRQGPIGSINHVKLPIAATFSLGVWFLARLELSTRKGRGLRDVRGVPLPCVTTVSTTSNPALPRSVTSL